MLGLTGWDIHSADIEAIRRDGGTYALCGKWVTVIDSPGTKLTCSKCLARKGKDNKEKRRDEREKDSLELGMDHYDYGDTISRNGNDDDGTGTGITK